ncbi:MAG: putative glycoside hydrolase [Candidatus Bipolaricaulota bacterium]
MRSSTRILCLLVTAAFFLLVPLLARDAGEETRPAARAAAPCPIVTPAPVAARSPHGRVGIYLTAYGARREDVLTGALKARQAGAIDTLVINVKDNHGHISYASQVPLARSLGAATGLLDFARILPILRAQGFYLIARQVVFNDPLLAGHLGYANGWVPADHATAVAYNLAVAEEVAALGFDEIQFDYIRYADGGGLAAGYEQRYQAINAFLAKVHAALGAEITLSADLFGRVMWDWNAKRMDPIGQSLEDMGRWLDVVSPMVYPSHYTEQKYKDGPYLVVKDALLSGRKRTATAIRPFLQAFDLAVPSGMTLEAYIAAQIRAAKDHGADGYLFWEPSNDYRALYRALGVE